ncbi:hypothetical protein MNSC_09550 [Minisyncoccus archaeophilus]|uniref:hypothetical protein n=1 Tax=Minisyncoccus archaeiphilus TaxID=3238481 RepID=UPI00399C66FC
MKNYQTKERLSAADISQIAKVAGLYALATGSADAYAITVSPAPTSLEAGDVFQFIANFTNVGATTINVNGLGVKSIKKNYNEALGPGDILSGQVATIMYDGANFQLISRAFDNFRIALIAGTSSEDTTSSGNVTVPGDVNTMVLKKSLTMKVAGTFTFRMIASRYTGGNNSNFESQLYKNGVAQGSIDSNWSPNPNQFTVDRSLTVAVGDVIDLYCRFYMTMPQYYGTVISFSLMGAYEYRLKSVLGEIAITPASIVTAPTGIGATVRI